MKKSIITVSVLSVFAVIGFAIALYMGNQPETTYYPDGKIKTIATRKFFQKNGDYSVFDADGNLSQKYNLVKGVKDGKAYVYNNKNVVELNYNNGVLSGDVVVDKKALFKHLKDLVINIHHNNLFEISAQTEKTDFVLGGKVVCNDEDLIDGYQKYVSEKTSANFHNFFKCFMFTSGSTNNPDIVCDFKGEYQYPQFSADSKFLCRNSAQKSFETINVESEYVVNSKTLVAKTFNPTNPKNVVNSSFKGVEEIVKSFIYFGASEKNEQDQGKLLADIIKNFTISDSEILVDNQKVSSSEGEFNFLHGFSNPYTVSYYTKEQATSQIKITPKGISLKLKYPVSKKPMLGIEINLDKTIKQKYTKLIQDLTNELSKGINIKDENLELILAQWVNYAWEFSDVIKSVNAVMWNNKGEKVLVSSATVTDKINFFNFLEDVSKNVDVKIVEYKDNKPIYLCKGNLADGFTVNNHPVDIDKIAKILYTPELEQTILEIGEELNATYDDVKIDWLDQEFTPVDPFLYGMYSGYVHAMGKHKLNKSVDQISLLVANIKTLFSSQGHYGGLDNLLALNVGVIPSEMYDENAQDTQEIKNNFGGQVKISSSKLNVHDAQGNQAFIIEYNGLPKQECVTLVTGNWEVNQDYGFVAIAAGKTGYQGANPETLSPIGNLLHSVLMGETSKAASGAGYLIALPNSAVSLPVSAVDALMACNGENNDNTVAFKYH